MSKSLDQALQIIEKDIKKIKKLSKNKETLDKIEAQKLNDYVKTLLAVQKEDREQSKISPVIELTDEELENEVKEALKTLKKEK